MSRPTRIAEGKNASEEEAANEEERIASTSKINVFFRHCPSCGRRFHIRLVHKKQVGSETVEEKLTQTEAEMESGLMHATPFITPLAEGPSIIVDIEAFE